MYQTQQALEVTAEQIGQDLSVLYSCQICGPVWFGYMEFN